MPEISRETSNVGGVVPESDSWVLPIDIRAISGAFVRVHGPFGSEATFFRESMRRHAITGRNIVCVLRRQVNVDYSGHDQSGERTHTPGKNWICT